MRDFFKSQFSGLHVLGIRQAEWTSQEQLTELLDELTAVSEKKFGYIPAEVQRNEIRKQIVEDPDFNGLNTRWLFKVLSRIAGKYWIEKYPEEKPADLRVLTVEEKANIDRIAEEFKRNLMGGFSSPIDQAKLEQEKKKIQHEDELSRKPQSLSMGYVPPTQEELILREQRRKWMLECFDPLTAKPTGNYIDFEEWLLLSTLEPTTKK